MASQVESVIPFSELAAAHMVSEQVQAIKAGKKILTPSDKILRIRMESVGLLEEPSAPDSDESAQAKAIVKPSHIPVATTMNSESLDCPSLFIRRGAPGFGSAAPAVTVVGEEPMSVLSYQGSRNSAYLRTVKKME